ncbi:DUF485 domain-containing protein [Actinokineospora sp. NBRC 105648]|uniref:DUF485 domain-containing protein n=1 Tax=Actinokineospora sp. NBRC 105648 TaxID=3032206 RepID=UPI0024A1AC1F|nr:DUF485 domain-containing protein [Actinokineospora sp. NBRC 105648]GLZ39492.1 hypothetical protein Acsp05_31160 [Actinokineospora sp. NBRC 105648]
MTEVVQPRVAARPPRPRSATFGGIGPAPGTAGDTGPDYDAIHAGPEFTALRARFRRFVFPMSALFLAWYLAYVLLAAYAKEFMAIRVFGAVNIGLLLGVAQFASTIAITAGYVRWARRRIDPEVAALREAAGVER